MSYILVTPIINETKHLQQLRDTIMSQSVRPVLWVIGDGGSTDGSYEIAAEMFREYDWVRVIRQTHFSESGYSHMNFANGVNDCLDYARKVCADRGIDYAFVGKTDATPVLASDYFSTLSEELAADPGIAFACGKEYLQAGPRGKKGTVKEIDAFNDIRLYRREFIEGMGGYPVFFSPDTLLLIKALNRGWKVKRSEKTHFVESRVQGSKIGLWKGYKLKGSCMYRLGYNPALFFLNALYYSKSYPFYPGIAALYGYVGAFARREDKINDPEVIRYFWRDRLVQVCKGQLTEGYI